MPLSQSSVPKCLCGESGLRAKTVVTPGFEKAQSLAQRVTSVGCGPSFFTRFVTVAQAFHTCTRQATVMSQEDRRWKLESSHASRPPQGHSYTHMQSALCVKMNPFTTSRFDDEITPSARTFHCIEIAAAMKTAHI